MSPKDVAFPLFALTDSTREPHNFLADKCRKEWAILLWTSPLGASTFAVRNAYPSMRLFQIQSEEALRGILGELADSTPWLQYVILDAGCPRPLKWRVSDWLRQPKVF